MIAQNEYTVNKLWEKSQ